MAVASEPRSDALAKAANAASPSASAGTSSMKLTPGRIAGEEATSTATAGSRPRANRRASAQVDATRVISTGASQSFWRKRLSPWARIARDQM